MDIAIVLVLLTAFALLVTAHVALAVGLFWRTPRWRAFLVFLLPPLAPYWGWTERLRLWSITWAVAALVYGVALIAAAV